MVIGGSNSILTENVREIFVIFITDLMKNNYKTALSCDLASYSDSNKPMNRKLT